MRVLSKSRAASFISKYCIDKVVLHVSQCGDWYTCFQTSMPSLQTVLQVVQTLIIWAQIVLSQLLRLMSHVLRLYLTVSFYLSFGLLSGLLPCTNSLNKTALEILVSSIQHMCPTHQRCSLIVWLSVLGTTHHSRTLTLETLANHLILQMDHRQHYWNCWRSLIWQRQPVLVLQSYKSMLRTTALQTLILVLSFTLFSSHSLHLNFPKKQSRNPFCDHVIYSH